MSKLNWISMKDKKKRPEIGQRCLTKMKHGIIEGTYELMDGEEGFYGYYWREMQWYASHWLPIEEAEQLFIVAGVKACKPF